jgi:hypothetical protein
LNAFGGVAKTSHGTQQHNLWLQPPEDITRRFSKLNRLIRVIAYCRRFINNRRHLKVYVQTTTLSTQELTSLGLAV